jgi:hypothetical protein
MVKLVKFLNLIIVQGRETSLHNRETRRNELQVFYKSLSGVVQLAACVAYVVHCIKLDQSSISMNTA